MKDVKIVIGANYGDEGKGLMTRHFVLQAKANHTTPIVVFHNGTAQRGHTVDYSADFRHVYHHFGSGTGDGAPTFFAKTFLIHPMEFRREMCEELIPAGIIPPICYCDPEAKVITPLDMVVDHTTEEHIAVLKGDREYGSCGYGSWCAAEDRIPMGRTAFTVADFANADKMNGIPFLMEQIWNDCLGILIKRGVDMEKSSYFRHLLDDRTHLIRNFIQDFRFFINHVKFISFDDLWKTTDSFVFENGQGLGLDMNVDNDWHTTSNTGLTNPIAMLGDKQDFSAEACYVTRSYLTRHGVGPMENRAPKTEINSLMIDKTNVPNDFQGSLRYGFLGDTEQSARIIKDFTPVMGDTRFKFEFAVTHTNEFDCDNDVTKYFSDNPYEVKERK